jgi:hypothetical protein
MMGRPYACDLPGVISSSGWRISPPRHFQREVHIQGRSGRMLTLAAEPHRKSKVGE